MIFCLVEVLHGWYHIFWTVLALTESSFSFQRYIFFRPSWISLTPFKSFIHSFSGFIFIIRQIAVEIQLIFFFLLFFMILHFVTSFANKHFFLFFICHNLLYLIFYLRDIFIYIRSKRRMNISVMIFRWFSYFFTFYFIVTDEGIKSGFKVLNVNTGGSFGWLGNSSFEVVDPLW